MSYYEELRIAALKAAVVSFDSPYTRHVSRSSMELETEELVKRAAAFLEFIQELGEDEIQ